MKANDIRLALQNNYLDSFKEDASTRILKELHICNGSSVADLAIINGSLYAFEIKSDVDTLNRLPLQINHYNKVFDYITIVTGENHLKKATEIVPDFWGIWTVATLNGQTVKTVIRETKRNTTLDAFSIAQFLWKEEIIDLLRKYNLHKGMLAKRKWVLWEFLAENFTLNILQEEVKSYLKIRENWKL